MIVIRKVDRNWDLVGEQNIYCGNECFNNSDEYKKYDDDGLFQCNYEIYTQENYPTITDFLSDDYIEYCSTCAIKLPNQDTLESWDIPIEIIDYTEKIRNK